MIFNLLFVFVVASGLIIAPKALMADAATENDTTSALNQRLLERKQWYEKKRNEESKVAPLVFFPGILGSQIRECPKGYISPSDCKIIWGNIESALDRSIDLTYDSGKTYSVDVVHDLRLPGTSFVGFEFYDNVLNYFQTRQIEGARLIAFPYDWRQSMAENAATLHTQLCKEVPPGVPLNFVAHSMGGLILRHWLEFYLRKPCVGDDQKTFQVDNLLFVATPLAGAPKAVHAAFTGYLPFFDQVIPDSWRSYITPYLMSALNKAGPSFDSFYELFPISTSEFCKNNFSPLGQYKTAIIATESNMSINIYDQKHWDTLGLAKVAGAQFSTKALSEKIFNKLELAEVLNCSGIKYDPNSIPFLKDVIYLYGGGAKKDTPLRLSVLTTRSQPPKLEVSQWDYGDQTVPIESAIGQPQRQGISKKVDLNHVRIINDSAVRRIVENWYAASEFLPSPNPPSSIPTSPVQRDGAIWPADRGRRLALFDLDAERWDTQEFRHAARHNKETLGSRANETSANAPWPADLSRHDLIKITTAYANSPQDFNLKMRALIANAEFNYGIAAYHNAFTSSKLAFDDPNFKLSSSEYVKSLAGAILGWSAIYVKEFEAARIAFISLRNTKSKIGQELYKEASSAILAAEKGEIFIESYAWQCRLREHYFSQNDDFVAIGLAHFYANDYFPWQELELYQSPSIVELVETLTFPELFWTNIFRSENLRLHVC